MAGPTCPACKGGFPLEENACPTCGRIRPSCPPSQPTPLPPLPPPSHAKTPDLVREALTEINEAGKRLSWSVDELVALHAGADLYSPQVISNAATRLKDWKAAQVSYSAAVQILRKENTTP